MFCKYFKSGNPDCENSFTIMLYVILSHKLKNQYMFASKLCEKTGNGISESQVFKLPRGALTPSQLRCDSSFVSLSCYKH